MDQALEEASWILNEGGMKRYHAELKASVSKKENIAIHGNKVTEK